MTETVASLRFARDRRGYEYFSLVSPSTSRRRGGRVRILYWFRTPPGVKVGRIPFDEDLRKLIETKNPDVRFDWARLLATPVPPPITEGERWRDRRRSERTERVERTDDDEDGTRESDTGTRESDTGTRDVAGASSEDPVASPREVASDSGPSSGQLTPPSFGDHSRRRRRRRGRGRQRDSTAASAGSNTESRAPDTQSQDMDQESRPEKPPGQ